MLISEAARKISSIFSQLSSSLLAENRKLNAQLEQLEAELKSAAEGLENARLWRENVLNGGPVLLEQSSTVFPMKPLIRLKRKMDDGNPPAASAEVEGEFS